MAEATLLCSDCIDLMQELPNGSVDCVIADPPYGTTKNRWDSVIPFPPLWEQLYRVCKRNAAMILFSQMPFTAIAVTSNLKDFRYEWIWQKSNKTGFLNAKKMPLKAHENILVFYRSLPTFNPQMTDGVHKNARKGKGISENYGRFLNMESEIANSYYPFDVLQFRCVNQQSRSKRFHPTQKPEALVSYLVKSYTGGGETVLDFCMGSGTTGVAAVSAGRNFIGMEINDKYFKIASKRIEDSRSQCKLENFE